ncbi:MAG: M56 family peptidase [Gammaproteobacteria bacterium]|nr:MAG: M56 family peptidase [Gammaproteobacteria bacterium]
MLINEPAIILNLLSIALMGLLLATLLLASVWPFMTRHIAQFSAATQKKLLWLFVAAPWGVSIICVSVFLPSLFHGANSSWLGQLAHWHHPYVFYLESWHAAILLMFMLGISYVLASKGLNAARHLHALDSLTHLSMGSSGSRTREKARRWEIGRDIVVLESKTPSAFAAGLSNPKCYVTTGLIEQVSETELDIILDHERAHIKHRDIRNKLLFALFASLYPRPVARRLNRSFSMATEQLADALVSNAHCKLDIAQTLVKAARIQRIFTGSLTGHGTTLVVNYFIADNVDLRVRALVTTQAFRTFPWISCLSIMMLTAILSAVGVDALHHLIEAFFSH